MNEVEDVLLIRDKNNFNFLRLLAAAGVVITHSYALLGLIQNDWLALATNGLLSFSRLGVYVFFVISGFLVANSLWYSPNLKSFFWKRFLRIFPALIVVLFLSVFFLGPLFTSSSLKEYFLRPGTYHYLIGGFSLYDVQYQLLGVFKNNPLDAVNGSLWTLSYEWTCYVILALFFVPLKKWKIFGPLCLILFLIALRFLVGRYQVFTFISYLKLDSRLFLFHAALFFTGVLGLQLRKHFKFRPLISLVLILLFCYLSFINRNTTFYLILFFVPYITLSVAGAQLPFRLSSRFSKVDFSYGLYIYAFPVSQILVSYFHNYLSVSYLAIFTLLFTAPFAVLSWYFIEKPAIRLKNTFFSSK